MHRDILCSLSQFVLFYFFLIWNLCTFVCTVLRVLYLYTCTWPFDNWHLPPPQRIRQRPCWCRAAPLSWPLMFISCWHCIHNTQTVHTGNIGTRSTWHELFTGYGLPVIAGACVQYSTLVCRQKKNKKKTSRASFGNLYERCAHRAYESKYKVSTVYGFRIEPGIFVLYTFGIKALWHEMLWLYNIMTCIHFGCCCSIRIYGIAAI